MLQLAPLCLLALVAPQDAGAESRPVDVLRSATIDHVRVAVAALEKAEAAGPRVARGFSAVYAGGVLLEGHYRTPGLRRRIPIRIAIDCAGPGTLAFRETTGEGAGATTETTLFDQGRVVKQASARAAFKEITGKEAGAALASALRWLPATVLDAALAARPSCRAGPAVRTEGASWSPITFTDAAARACTLLLDEGGRLARIELLAAHPRLGDVCEWTRFEAYETRDSVLMPARVARFDVAQSVTFEWELELESFRVGPPPADLVRVPETRRSEVPGFAEPASATAGYEFVELAPDLWSVEIAAADARALVIDRKSDLVLLDAPDGDDVTSGLLKALAAKFPSSPLRLVAFGHHHPSPSGGLRALATGVTIIAPKGLEGHIRWLLARPVSLGGAAVAGPLQPALQFFENRTTIEAGANTVVLLDIADRSAHAFHYVVFWFPSTGIVFEDDLGYFPEKGRPNWSTRLAGLGAALAEAKIVPKRLVQSWPVKGGRREIPWTEVQELLDRPPTRPTGR